MCQEPGSTFPPGGGSPQTTPPVEGDREQSCDFQEPGFAVPSPGVDGPIKYPLGWECEVDST